MPPKKALKRKEPSPSSSKKQPKRARNEKESPLDWLELPRDMTASILQRLSTIEILETAPKVCMSWRNLCKDFTMWHAFDMHNSCNCIRDLRCLPHNLKRMCIHAIDCSCGQLRDINIDYVGNDKLLTYITTQSSGQLRHLRLVCCGSISEKRLREVAAKLLLLEELDITLCFLTEKSLEAVGRCCPLLKSLKWNQQWDATDKENVEEAVSIAKNMPELRHLQLIGNQLTNDGLQAILDGCPHLESLDIRKCFNVTLSGNLGRRCAQRIKNLQRPDHSTYEL